MGLFRKDKKGKDEDKAKGKKRLQDRFMVMVLNAKFPDAKSNEILEFKFTDRFSEKNVTAIGKLTDRVLLGRGEFEKLYQQSKLITRNYAQYISGDDDPDDNLVNVMIRDFTKLQTDAEAWLQSSEAKWSKKDVDKQDLVTQRKEIEARGMLKGARIALFQLKNRTKLQDPATQKMVTELEAARDKATAKDATEKDQEAYRAADAQVLMALCGSSKSKDGTSDVELIKGPDGDVAYAFKSMEGESDMMGTPKGFATAREVMMSHLCEQLKARYDLDFPWPKATMATMGGKPGALIEGVQGMKTNTTELGMGDVPAETMQKILLCNLAGGNFDIKWEDARFVRKGDQLEATCMDGGAAMPDADTATTLLFGNGDCKPGQTIIENGDPNTGNCYPEALKPIDAKLVKQFLSINTKEIRADMAAQVKQLEKDHKLSAKDLGLDGGIDTAMTSIEGIQKIINDAGGNITLADFLKAYHDEVVEKTLVGPRLDAWKKARIAEYRKLVAAHGELFAPPDKDVDVPSLYTNVLHPHAREKLKALIDLAKPKTVADLLKTYGMPVPIMEVSSGLVRDINNARQAVAGGLKEYDKQLRTYPGAIVPKDSFASPEQAYREVLGKLQISALKAFQERADKLSKSEGKQVTVASLLQRYGHRVPTSDFSAKLMKILENESAEEARKAKEEKERKEKEKQ